MKGGTKRWDSRAAVAEDDLAQLKGLREEFRLGPAIQIKENVTFKFIESSCCTTSPPNIWRINKITVKYTCKINMFAAEEAG